MEKKKILFAARDLKIGGIEKALVTLLNYLVDEYDITLVLEKKEGELLRQLDYKVKIEEYTPSEISFMPLRKAINFINRLRAIYKYKDKFDISVAYATYSLPSSFIARIASKNNILWCHTDYSVYFNNNEKMMMEFFEQIKFYDFRKMVFVSKAAMKSFLKTFPTMENKLYQCNNLINFKHIQELSKESVDIKKEDIYTFLNVGRHEERAKRLTRIIEAAKKLKDEGYKFRVIFVGDGDETEYYKDLTKEYGLKEYILFTGKKSNPYPYFNIADSVILSSDYEGYPVVFLESFVLNKPIITTNVSDYNDVENGRGVIAPKTINGIYQAMKKMIDDGYEIKNQFNGEQYNKEIKEILKAIFEKL